MDNNEFKELYQGWLDTLTANFPYTNPAIFDTKEEFPILNSGIMYMQGGKTVPVENFKEIRDCGFNISIYKGFSKDTIEANYDNANAANVKLLGWSNEFANSSSECLSKVKNKPAFAGINLCDEPKPGSLTGDDIAISAGKNLWELYYFFKKELALASLMFINLRYISETDTDGYTKEYLENFQQYFMPALFSYDYYPITERSNLIHEGLVSYPIQEGWLVFDKKTFYYNLEEFSKISKKYSRPFWAFCESMNTLNLYRAAYHPVALEQYLRFEAFSALAYGAKGIVYWTYNMRETNDSESYLSSLLNRLGEKTASWYFAQKINQEIHKYSYIFLSGEHKNANLTNNYSYRSTNPHFKFNISSSDQSEFLIGEFIYGKDTYLMVVSADPFNYHNINLNVSTYNETWAKITELTPIISNGKENTILENGINERIMPPGGYRIFKFLTVQPVITVPID